MNRLPGRRSGYTLLEIMLVLLIVTILVAAAAAALNVYLRAVETGRAQVEQAQLARTLLRNIADDLRAAVPRVVDNAEVMSTVSASSLSGSGSGSSSGSGAGGSSGSGSSSSGSGSSGSSSANITNITGSTGVMQNIGGSSGSSGTTSPTSASSASDASGTGSSAGSSSGSRSSGGSGSSGTSSGGSSSSGSSGSSGSNSSGGSTGSGSSGGTSSSDSSTDSSEATITPLGVYGNQYDLQIDVSRLPRTDRIDALTGTIAPSDPSQAADPPSDVKTVSYYISTTTAAAASNTDPAAVPLIGGLVRRQLDRSVVNYSTLYGGAADTGVSEKVLAPEATALEFRYFDGTEWVTTWDSSDRQAVPVAVEVYLTLRSNQPAAGGISTLLTGSPELPQEQTYRLMVHLPAGEPSTSGASTEEASTTESTEGTETTP